MKGRRFLVPFTFDCLKRTSLWERLETFSNCFIISCNLYSLLMRLDLCLSRFSFRFSSAVITRLHLRTWLKITLFLPLFGWKDSLYRSVQMSVGLTNKLPSCY